jgi:toxin-antitoxin system PIN domain toxin
VKVVDSNVLLYARNVEAEHHDASRRWMERELDGADTVGFSWVALLAFVRIATKVGLFANPLSVTEAIEQVQSWLDRPNAVLLEPTARHFHVVAGLLGEVGTGGNLTTDAHIATLAIEHHGEVISWDNDFGRFPGVRWSRPSDN